MTENFSLLIAALRVCYPWYYATKPRAPEDDPTEGHMKVICAWCRKEGKSDFLREKPPLSNVSETHSICGGHAAELRLRFAVLSAAVRRSQAEAERRN
jgi:hypothetical protein